LDLIEPGFRPRYEEICVGNKPADAQDVFFEGLLLQEGLGGYFDYRPSYVLVCNQLEYFANHEAQAKINRGTAIQPGDILPSIANPFVLLR
jgi:hypothetical protein